MQVIDSKDETCKAAKDEQINLENFRYMLDQKIKMLQNEKGQILTKITEKEVRYNFFCIINFRTFLIMFYYVLYLLIIKINLEKSQRHVQ